jgi:hypothetical protein
LSVGSKIHLGGTVDKARLPSVIHSDSLNTNYLPAILINLKKMKDFFINNYYMKNNFFANYCHSTAILKQKHFHDYIHEGKEGGKKLNV